MATGSAVVAMVGGILLRGATVGNGDGTADDGGSTGSSWTGVPASRVGIGKRVQAGRVSLASSGVLASGEYGRDGSSATAGKGDGDLVCAVVEVGELVVVRAVGLGVRIVHSPVERVGCPGIVAAGAAGVSAGRQSAPLPGGGEGRASTVGRFWHRCLGSQLEHSRPASLHSQRVRMLALHFASLVQLQQNAKVSPWR